MKSFYEKPREDDRCIHISRNRKNAYPAHFHQNIEIYILNKGEYSLSINARSYLMKDGMIAVIDSYDVHEYVGGFTYDDCALVIPYRYLDRFNAARGDMAIENNIITSPKLCEELLWLADTYLRSDSDFTRDSAVQLLLSRLISHLSFSANRKRGDANLARKILTYIQANYKNDISRSDIASAVGYTEAHVSRVFHKYLGRGINDYINSLRYEHMLREKELGSDKTLTELIYESGFGSEQTYYRYKSKHK